MAQEAMPLAERQKRMEEFFEVRKGQIGMALARVGITPDRLVRALFTSAQKSPDLLKCTLPSVYKSMLLAAQAGLMPDGITQQAHLIPRENRRDGTFECNLQVGYKGYLTLVRRSGEVTVVKGALAREGDEFRVLAGTEDRLEHVPLMSPLDADGNPRPITHAYAIAKFKNGQVDFDVMSVEEIEALKVRSGVYENGPWATDYGEMCKKTVMRRLCKRLPQSEDAARLLELDAQAEGGMEQRITDREVSVPPPDEIPAAPNVEAEVADEQPF
jgi:recombination protein RecT